MNKKLLSIITIFIGSALLFGVQPMVGRTILPYFGGTSTVWIVCLCAFQVLLLGGYLYADRMTKVRGRAFLFVHVGLLVASALWAFYVAGNRSGLCSLVTGLPAAFGVIAFLVAIVGLPYLSLSANASLVQSLSSTGDKDVYRLYAISNVGSFVGLFIYPFVLDPYVSVFGQWRLFAAGIAVYAVLLLFLVLSKGKGISTSSNVAKTDRASASVPLLNSFLWVLLPALSCACLNAVTAELTLNVIAMPLLWCVLLALFLLTYVIGFAGVASRFLVLWDYLALVSAGVLAFSTAVGGGFGFCWQLGGGCGLVLFGGIALHARLYELRPETSLLTRYYLFGAIGGALGGVFTGLLAPVVFADVLEYPVVVFSILLLLALLRDWKRWTRQLPFGVIVVIVLTVFALRLNTQDGRMGDTVFKDRGFFGTVRVTTSPARTMTHEGVFHQFWHGSTLHCGQFVAPGYPLKATLYHGPLGGGFAITQHPKYKSGQPMRVGIVGMGMGVSCAYGRSNDVYRCWEISPEAINLATNGQYFSFATANPAKVESILADARMALEEERAKDAPKYDVLQIDAFSGDSAPYYLCTEEAFKLYFDRVAEGGYLSVNITNWHMDLTPLIKAAAVKFEAHTLVYMPDARTGATPCAWALMMKEAPRGFAIPKELNVLNLKCVRDWEMPTDEKGSLIDLIRIAD